MLRVRDPARKDAISSIMIFCVSTNVLITKIEVGGRTMSLLKLNFPVAESGKSSVPLMHCTIFLEPV